MYSGLALLPWVLLYGVTALLFNHSGWMSSTRSEEVSASSVADLNPLSSADELARAFGRQLTREVAAGGAQREYAFVDGSARWLGSFQLAASTDSTTMRMSLDPELRGGILRTSPKVNYESDPNALQWPDRIESQTMEQLGAPTREKLLSAARTVAEDHDQVWEEGSVRRWPTVRFLLASGEDELQCEVRLDGHVEVEPGAQSTTLRRRLLRLHLQHGDPGYAGVKSIWALLVDAMGIAMIVWALSGVIMWWAIRKTRRAGSVAVSLGIGSMMLLAGLIWRAAGM